MFIHNSIQGILHLLNHYPLISIPFVFSVHTFLNLIPFTLSVAEMIITYCFINAFGTFLGYFIAVVLLYSATVCGCVIALYIGRRFFQNRIRKMVLKYPMLRNLQGVIATSDLETIILIRAAPVPIQIISYFLAITDIEIGKYTLATVGVLPHIFLNSLIGSTCAQIEDILDGSWRENTSPVIGILITAVLVILLLATLKALYSIKQKIEKLSKEQEECYNRYKV